MNQCRNGKMLLVIAPSVHTGIDHEYCWWANTSNAAPMDDINCVCTNSDLKLIQEHFPNPARLSGYSTKGAPV